MSIDIAELRKIYRGQQHAEINNLLDEIERLRAEKIGVLKSGEYFRDETVKARERIAELETALRDLGELVHAALAKKPTGSESV